MKYTCCRLLPTLAVLATILLIACGADATVAPAATEPTSETLARDNVTRAQVLQSLTANVILPGYIAAAAGMVKLQQSVDSLCASPGETGLETARQDWRAARQAWLRTESFRFGPAMDRRSASLVDWWPVDKEGIDEILDSVEAVTTERVSEFLPATRRGLGGAEHLLFGPGSDELADGSAQAGRCAYLLSIAAVSSDEVNGILADWQGTEEAKGYASYYDGTGSLALLDKEAEAIAVRSLVFQVRAIANMRLGAALGIEEEADASAIPAGAADNSLEDLLSQLDSISAVYRGADDGGCLGLSARVASGVRGNRR